MPSFYFHYINKQSTHQRIMYDKTIFFPSSLFYSNCHHNFSSLSLSFFLSYSCTSVYCIECVSLLLFSSFCFFFSSFFFFCLSFSLVFLSPLGSTCCLILWARFANGIRQNEQKKTSACLLLVIRSSVQNTSDNTNSSI